MTILVIEDNPISRKLVRVALQAAGYGVIEASDGQSAVMLMQQHHPDLVLQDLVLPDVNGFDLVARLRALPEGEKIPILAMTGLFGKADEAPFATAPFTDYLFKPVEPSLLVVTVGSYLPPGGKKAPTLDEKPRVLVVDDEPSQRKLLTAYLRNLDFEVATAENGLDALAQTRARRPDAIVSDVLMPGMDGFALCMELRSDPELAGIPVVLHSNHYGQSADAELARQVGAFALVQSSPDFRETAEALRRSLQAAPAERIGDMRTANTVHHERLADQLQRHAVLSAQLARRCAAQSAQIAVLASIGENFLAGKVDPAALLEEILASYLNVMGATCGALYLGDGECSLTLSAQIGFPAGAADALADFFGHEAVLRDAMRKGDPVAITRASASDAALKDIVAALDANTLVISPLRFSSDTLGVIVLTSGTESLGADWVPFSKAITNQIGQVIALSRAMTKLRRLASYDALTDLPNRAHLREAIGKSIAAGKHAALYLLNLDRFQEINNTLGYRNGDRLLREIGERLTAALQPGTIVARLGADEFAVFAERANGETIQKVAGKIVKNLEPSFRLDGLPIGIRAAVGIALTPEHAEDPDTLLSYADMSRRAAKETGHDALIYPQHVEPYSADHLVLLAELRDAIEQDKLLLHFQPKVALDGAETVGVEALLRWPHPERGWIPPDLFIPLAEKAGVIHALTLWVMGAALRQSQRWREAGHELQLAINVSARDLQDPSFPDFLERLCVLTATPPQSLTLELTERSLMADPAKIDSTFRRLNDIGVQFSIDDFGTGYSALWYLQKLPVHEIKIDKSFVSGLLTDARSGAIVRSIIDLGRNLGFRVIAEGVEDQRTWKRLAELRCDAAQGYYISRPLPAADLTRWMEQSAELHRAPEPARERVIQPRSTP